MEKSQDLPDICINQNNTLSPPEPSKDIARFLGWLMKLGGVQDLKRCEKKWERKRLNVEESIKNFDISFIRIQTLRGEKVVVLVDWAWADQWVTYYGFKLPHHRQMQRAQK